MDYDNKHGGNTVMNLIRGDSNNHSYGVRGFRHLKQEVELQDADIASP